MVPLLRHQTLLVLVAVVLFVINLGHYALFDDDEAKMAGCAAEMYRHGAWIVPTFNDQRQGEQPILAYWLMLTSYGLLGVSEFSARFPSAVLAVGTILLTYHLGRKLYSAEVGFLAGIVLCTCLWFSAFGRAATADSAQIFFVTLAFASYVWVIARQRSGNFNGPEKRKVKIPGSAIENASPDTVPASTPAIRPIVRLLVPRTWQVASPMFAAMGLAALTMGVVGVLLPCAAILAFLLLSLRRDDLKSGKLKSPEGARLRRWFMTVAQILRPRQILEASRGLHLLIGIGIVAAIALPWYLTVGVMTHGAWLHGFFWDQNFGQVLSFSGDRNGFPFYQLYYLVMILFCCLPWSVFLPVALYQLKQRLTDNEDEDVLRGSDVLLVCWIGVWFMFFSLDDTRQSNYILPMYPALALILGRYFRDWQREEGDAGVYSFNICCKALGIVGGIAVLGLYVTAFLYFPSAQWIGLIGVIPMAAAFVAIEFLDQDLRRRVLQTLVLSAVLVAFLLFGIAPVQIRPYQDSPIFVADARRLAGSSEIDIATFDYFEPSLVFYVGKPVPKLETANEVADFISSRPHAYVITKASRHNELRDVLVGDVDELSRHRNFLGRQELILLGRK